MPEKSNLHPTLKFIKENLNEYEFEEKNNGLFLKKASSINMNSLGELVVVLTPLKVKSWVDIEVRLVKDGKTKEIFELATKLAKEIEDKLAQTLEIKGIKERITDHLKGLSLSLTGFSLQFARREEERGLKEDIGKVVIKNGIFTRIVFKGSGLVPS